MVNLLAPDAVLDKVDFNKVSDMVYECSPRFLMGMFGSTPEEVKTLAEKFCGRGTHPFVQPWRYNDEVHFYPNYITPLGPGGALPLFRSCGCPRDRSVHQLIGGAKAQWRPGLPQEIVQSSTLGMGGSVVLW